MNRGKGFALVDLLVVLMVLAMLAVIAIPSLNVSSELLKQMGCRSNMHSLSKSMHLYCQANNDYWPPYRMATKNGQPYVNGWYNDVEFTFWASKAGDLDPTTLKQRFRGVGIMYDSGFVEDPRNFYCPAQTYPWFMYESYVVNEHTGESVPWGTWDNWSNMVRTGFLFQAWGKFYADEGIAGRWDIAFRTLSSMENDKAMALDHALMPWASAVHLFQGGQRVTFNALHPDGHVDMYSCTKIIDVLTEFWIKSNGEAFIWIDYPGDNNDWAEVYTQLQAGI
jgi:competence protein ComGC